jgi:hypothetical protein
MQDASTLGFEVRAGRTDFRTPGWPFQLPTHRSGERLLVVRMPIDTSRR